VVCLEHRFFSRGLLRFGVLSAGRSDRPAPEHERAQRQLFLKVCGGSNASGGFDDNEVRLYARDYLDVPEVSLPLCYDVHFDRAA
jgi:hypothetical protein